MENGVLFAVVLALAATAVHGGSPWHFFDRPGLREAASCHQAKNLASA